MATEIIDHSTFTRLVAAGDVRGAHIVGQPGGWSVVVKLDKQERALATTNRRSIRRFRRFETLVAYLKDVGLSQFDVDASHYDQAAITSTRPDRTTALKRVHDAAAYDTWFRAEVQAALDDPRPAISDEEASAHMSRILAELEGTPTKKMASR